MWINCFSFHACEVFGFMYGFQTLFAAKSLITLFDEIHFSSQLKLTLTSNFNKRMGKENQFFEKKLNTIVILSGFLFRGFSGESIRRVDQFRCIIYLNFLIKFTFYKSNSTFRKNTIRTTIFAQAVFSKDIQWSLLFKNWLDLNFVTKVTTRMKTFFVGERGDHFNDIHDILKYHHSSC